MNDLEKMSEEELHELRVSISKELYRRERIEYDKAVKNFADALDELYNKFPYEYCFADETVDWEDLRERYDWVF